MKKIIVTLIGFGFLTAASAQEAFDKKYQFGIALGTGFNMNKTSSLVDRKGVGTDQTLGLNLNYNMNPTLTLTTGLEFDFEAYKYTPRDTMLYFFKDENKIVQKDELDTNKLSDYTLYSLKERQYKTTYLILPVFVTLKTKPFGNMQYFGKFGSRIGIKTGGRINDTGEIFKSNSLNGAVEAKDNNSMILKDDVRLFKINAGVSGGAMWNFSGTTMLVGEIGYFFGLTQIHYDEKALGDDPKANYTLFNTDGVSSVNQINYSKQKYSQPAAKQGQILIKFTLFF